MTVQHTHTQTYKKANVANIHTQNPPHITHKLSLTYERISGWKNAHTKHKCPASWHLPKPQEGWME